MFFDVPWLVDLQADRPKEGRQGAYGGGGCGMTLAEINRMIRASIRAARQEGAPAIEVKVGNDATVRISLVPTSDKSSEQTELDAWVTKHAR